MWRSPREDLFAFALRNMKLHKYLSCIRRPFDLCKRIAWCGLHASNLTEATWGSLEEGVREQHSGRVGYLRRYSTLGELASRFEGVRKGPPQPKVLIVRRSVRR